MNLTDFAHEYHLAGLQTIPTYNKAPSKIGGTNYLEQYKGSDFIDQYFPGATQMGVVCGEVSGNLTCFDFDQHQDGQNVVGVFEDFVKDSIVKHLIDTKQAAVYSSPSGGRHIFVRTPETEHPKILSKYKTGDVMIELRGQGQYMICYPSPGYTHLLGAELIETNEIDDEAFLHMVELSISFSEIALEENTIESDDTERKWGQNWKPTTPDGFYNINEGAAAFELLMENGWQEIIHRRRDTLRFLTRPGKDTKDGISATWGYRENMFYVFSQSVGDFPIPHGKIGKAYSPFDILVRYKYNGDWRKAKDDLRELYGMQKKVKVKPPILTQDEESQFRIEPFPIGVFTEDMQNFIKQLNQTLNYSPDILACSIISVISSLIGNSMRVQVRTGWETPMIFWFMVRGRAGTIKSHPVNTIVKPMKSINRVAFDVYQEQLKEWSALEDQEKNKTARPVFKQVVVDDATVESYRKILSYNPRGVLMHNDEIKKFINGMNKYKSGDAGEEAFWLSSFNNDSFTVNRVKDDPVVIDNTFINIIGTIQNDVLDDIISRSQESGFIDRFLFTRSEKLAHKISTKNMDRHTLNWWDEYCVTLHSRFNFYEGNNHILVHFSPAAFKDFIEVDANFVTISNNEDSTNKMRSYISKIRTYIPRFALFFCVIDHLDHDTQSQLLIEPTHVERASKIAEYFYNTGMSIFEDNKQTAEIRNVDSQRGLTNAERVVNLIGKGFTQKQISEHLKTSPAYISKLVKKLKENGEI